MNKMLLSQLWHPYKHVTLSLILSVYRLALEMRKLMRFRSKSNLTFLLGRVVKMPRIKR